MRIEAGYNTDQPIRERGWTYWHHLFNPRQLLTLAILKSQIEKSPEQASKTLGLARCLDRDCRLVVWHNGWQKPEQVFYNPANTSFSYGVRSPGVFFQQHFVPRLRIIISLLGYSR